MDWISTGDRMFRRRAHGVRGGCVASVQASAERASIMDWTLLRHALAPVRVWVSDTYWRARSWCKRRRRQCRKRK